METESTHSPQVAKSEKSERYATLQVRKETLEAKLQEKNNELKLLCIKEAELTGYLPPEIPLEPGEAIPTFRRRVGTSFTLPENLINKLKSEEEHSLSALELEFEIQRHITDVALKLANDDTAKKALRRQRRFEYHQHHRRLVDIEARLNQIRINQSQAQKHRKKPRPSIDSGSGGENSADKDSLSHDGGIPLSPLSKSTHTLIGGGNNGGCCYIDAPYQKNGNQYNHSHSRSHLHYVDTKVAKSQERLHSTLSAPQYSSTKLKAHSPDSRGPRPQLQRLGSGGYFAYGMYQQGYASPQYPTLASCAHPELERLSRHDTAFIMSPYWNIYPPEMDNISHHSQYGSGRTVPNPSFISMDELDGKEEAEVSSRHPSLEGRIPRWTRNRFGSLDRKKHMAHSSPCLESRSVEGLDALQLQAEGLDVPDKVAYIMPPTRAAYTLEKLPSASKLKQMEVKEQPLRVGPTQGVREDSSWQHSHPAYYIHHSKSHHRPPAHGSNLTVTGDALLPGQTYPEHSFGQQLLATPPDRGLTRTQSLGSVETTNPNSSNSDTRSIKDMYPSTSYTQQKNYDSIRKLKEKEWYETSLDVLSSAQNSRPPSRRPSGHSGYEVKIPSSESHSSMSNLSASLSNNTSTSVSHSSSFQGESTVLQIETETTNEQNYPRAKSELGNEFFDTVVPFESPKNHTVIQAGKWQPYWEVTKPFEMSDFYKYSTKYRKKNGANSKESGGGASSPQGHPPQVQPTQQQQHQQQQHNGHSSPSLHIKTEESVLQSSGSHGRVPPPASSPTPSMTPQQKGIYQPLQPMTCQPVEVLGTEQATKGSPLQRGRAMSPNESLDMSANRESLADAFSTEMLAWYQDQNSGSPRSATLV